MKDPLLSVGAAPRRYSYELPMREPAAGPAGRSRNGGSSLPEPILRQNAEWFCRLRWIVVAFLAAFGAFARLPGSGALIGEAQPPLWPFLVAGALALANVAALTHLRMGRPAANGTQTRANLWAQISGDLVVLTVVVHFVGCLDTDIPYAYLFHIVLACMFLSRPESFAATMVALGLYGACVVLEATGLLSARGVLLGGAVTANATGAAWKPAFRLVSVGSIWLVVWYLASRLGEMVRERDRQLAETNQLLREAHEQKAKHIIRTTHELKAPFAAIQANVAVLLNGYCGELPERATEVLGRVSARCDLLATEIQEMLHLASLRSTELMQTRCHPFDLCEVVDACVAQLRPVAEERGIALEVSAETVPLEGDPEQFHLLISNLAKNAVSYSCTGGQVRLELTPAGRGARLVVEDQGIGIPPDKLPHIFDEYYRTEEAMAHNRSSTGLGLAIVNEIAQRHRLRIRVETEPGAGTKFTVMIPACADLDALGRTDGSGRSSRPRSH